VQYLDEGLKGWMIKTAKNNLWKMGSWYELDDLIQEGYLVYFKCVKGFRFEPWDVNGVGGLHGKALTLEEQRQRKNKVWEKERQKTFMAYFKFAYENRLRTLATEKVPETNFASLPIEKEDEVKSNLEVPQPEETSLHVALMQAPQEVVEALMILVKDVKDAGVYLRSRVYTELGWFHKTGAYIMSNTPRVVVGRYQLRETSREYYARRLGYRGFELLKAYFLEV